MSDCTTHRGQILLVEDDPAVRGVLALLLESAGWNVTEAADGNVGLLLARRTRPDLVVTDLRLPGMSGTELATALTDGSDVPVVAITSDTAQTRARARQSGRFASVLTKPLDPNDFLLTVHRTRLTSLEGPSRVSRE